MFGSKEVKIILDKIPVRSKESYLKYLESDMKIQEQCKMVAKNGT